MVLSNMVIHVMGVVLVVVLLVAVAVALLVGSVSGSCHDGRSMRGSGSGNEMDGNGSATRALA
jgi:hypothetical protein